MVLSLTLSADARRRSSLPATWAGPGPASTSRPRPPNWWCSASRSGRGCGATSSTERTPRCARTSEGFRTTARTGRHSTANKKGTAQAAGRTSRPAISKSTTSSPAATGDGSRREPPTSVRLVQPHQGRQGHGVPARQTSSLIRSPFDHVFVLMIPNVLNQSRADSSVKSIWGGVGKFARFNLGCSKFISSRENDRIYATFPGLLGSIVSGSTMLLKFMYASSAGFLSLRRLKRCNPHGLMTPNPYQIAPGRISLATARSFQKLSIPSPYI